MRSTACEMYEAYHTYGYVFAGSSQIQQSITWWLVMCVFEHLSQRVLHQTCTETSDKLVACVMLSHHVFSSCMPMRSGCCSESFTALACEPAEAMNSIIQDRRHAVSKHTYKTPIVVSIRTAYWGGATDAMLLASTHTVHY